MLVDYFYWQYVWAPRFLLQTIWNLQRALLRFFSVSFMLRTFLSHWHKDAIPYQGGTLSNLALTFLWNQISRLIGIVIRLGVLASFLAAEIIFLPLAVIAFLLFMAWPLIILVALSVGIGFLTFIFS